MDHVVVSHDRQRFEKMRRKRLLLLDVISVVLEEVAEQKDCKLVNRSCFGLHSIS